MQQLQTLFTVLLKPRYFLVALLVSWFVFTVSVWLPNGPLLLIVIQNSSSAEILSFFWSMYGAIETNFSGISATYTILISILFGSNVALLMYYLKKNQGMVSSYKKTGAVGLGGLVSGVFGIGCAACGTFILTSILSLVGAGGVLVYLPFGGQEFGFIGVALLTYTMYMLLKKINDPQVCDVVL